MLTEGWDANTVTHILGVRAFGTQLLCEQVVGRGLRRVSYAVNDQGHFDPEYADVYGVPFSFIPVAGIPEPRASAKPRIGNKVQAIPERLAGRPWLEVTFPRVTGYRYDVPPERLAARFDASHRVVLTTQDIPNRIENAPIVGETVVLTLDHLKDIRPQTVAFKLATHLQQHHFKDRPWLFPQLLGIVRDWLGNPDGDSPYVDYGDETFPGLLLFVQKANEAAEKIKRAIIGGSGGEQRLRAELPETDRIGTTAGVAYDTVKTVFATDPAKCHLNFVPEDSGWETIVVERLQRMDEVRAYVKNQNLGFRIPYTFEGRPGNYYPDLIVKLDDGRGPEDLLHLILEVSGEKKKEKEAKVQTAKTLWVPAVNNEGAFGRWAFLEIDGSTLHKAMQEVRKFLKVS
jgi:type III restriction enzyme